MKAIERAVDAAGGQLALAKKLGVSYQAVQKWLRSGVPADRVLAVESATGVSRHDLRPDIYPRDTKNAAPALRV
jgi:DNA-binding transcriptional regulator YdaS (Cro superfamily)